MATEQAPVETAAAAAAPTPTKKSAARFITPALALIAALGVGGVAGVVVGQSTAASSSLPAGFTPGQFPGAGDGDTDGGIGDFTSGTVTSIDGDIITVTLADGSTVTVTTSADTTVSKTTDATVADLAAGEEIVVSGTKDDAGNVTATSITQGAGLPGGAFPGGTPPTQGDDD